MNEWQQLVKQCILGTGQHPLQLPASKDPYLHGALQACLDPASSLDRQQTPDQPDPPQQEKQLLAAISLLANYRQAGTSPWQLLPNREDMWRQSNREVRPYCPQSMTAMMKTFIFDSDLVLLKEALGYVLAAQQVFSPLLLPKMLSLAVTHLDMRILITQTMGERGQWLCRQNPTWLCLLNGRLEPINEGVNDGVDSGLWQTSQGLARQWLLQQVRLTDPALARQQLAQVWAKESAKERLLLLEALRVGLSSDDLPSLWVCQKDRSVAIRALAVQYRLQLADASLQRSIINLLGDALLLVGGQLQITLPENFAPEWQAYGIQEKADQVLVSARHSGKVGYRSIWLYQLLSLIAPSKLAAHIGCSVAELVKQVTNSTHDFFLSAFDSAAFRVADQPYLNERYRQMTAGRQLAWLTLCCQRSVTLGCDDEISRWFETVLEARLTLYLNQIDKTWIDGLDLLISWGEILQRNGELNGHNRLETAAYVGQPSLSPALSVLVIKVCLCQFPEYKGRRYVSFYAIEQLGYLLDLSVFETIMTLLVNAEPDQLLVPSLSYEQPFSVLQSRYQQRFDLNKAYN